MNSSFLFVWSFAVLSLAPAFGHADEGKSAPQITVEIDGFSASWSAEELQRRAPVKALSVPDNPAYDHKELAYYGVSLKSLLPAGLDLSQYKIVFTCLDQYSPEIKASELNEGLPLLAFREVRPGRAGVTSADNLWSMVDVRGEMQSPGPFYLVWDSLRTYPDGWPFQLTKISFVRLNK